MGRPFYMNSAITFPSINAEGQTRNLAEMPNTLNAAMSLDDKN
jgi:hypothetical protein